MFSLSTSALQPEADTTQTNYPVSIPPQPIRKTVRQSHPFHITMSARTRRQKASLAAEESEDSPSNGSVSTPSKRASSKKRARSAAREESKESKESKENIFLFTPNLIGRLPRWCGFKLQVAIWLTRSQDIPESF